METTPDLTQSESLPQQSLVRFSAFNMMAFVTMMAILLAFVVPYVQGQALEVQPVLCWTIGFAAVIALLAFVVICALRWRVEKIGGPLVMRAATIGWVKWMFVVLLAPLMIWSVVLLIKSVVVMAAASEMLGDDGVDIMMTLSIAVPICILAYVGTLIWWNVSPSSLEIRERGLVLGSLGFVPFSSKPKLEWKPGAKTGFRVLTVHCPNPRVSIIKASEKDAIDAALREREVTVES